MLEVNRVGNPTGIFSETIFTRRASVVSPSPFIRAMHPKSEIRAVPAAIQLVLERGWIAQSKIHGHRAQVHVPADLELPIFVYTRQGKAHTKALSPSMEQEIRRVFGPRQGWNAIDTEWLKAEDKLFVFDFLKKEDEVLRRMTFPQRWQLLPRAYLSPHLITLPLIRDLEGCLKVLASPGPHIEGLVFKSPSTPGFADTSIVRCRRRVAAE